VFLAGFDLVNLLDGGEIDRVNRQPIKGIGGQCDDVALAQAGDNVVDPVRLRFIGWTRKISADKKAYLGSYFETP